MFRSFKKIFLFLVIVALFVATPVVAEDVPVATSDEFFLGKVTTIISDETKSDEFTGEEVSSQVLLVEILDGEEKGEVYRVNYETTSLKIGLKKLDEGLKVVVGKSVIPEGADQYYISDVYRIGGLKWLFAVFVLLTILFTGKYGVRALIGLGISFLVIVFWLVPQLLSGANPTFTSLLATLVIAFSSLYVAHGFHRRTTVALVSTLVTILISFLVAYLSTKFTFLFGGGSESALYISFTPDVKIDLRGLLLGGMIIGTLGVLDDITTAQSAIVEQLKFANPKLGFGELYKRASLVGREHIVSLVNTLILAYTGVALPLLLLFNLYDRPMWVVVNSELVMEELIRMLVGSIALTLAVPLTTVIAAWEFSRKKPTETADHICGDHKH